MYVFSVLKLHFFPLYIFIYPLQAATESEQAGATRKALLARKESDRREAHVHFFCYSFPYIYLYVYYLHFLKHI